jgi:hypothetical protein
MVAAGQRPYLLQLLQLLEAYASCKGVALPAIVEVVVGGVIAATHPWLPELKAVFQVVRSSPDFHGRPWLDSLAVRYIDGDIGTLSSAMAKRKHSFVSSLGRRWHIWC